MSQRELNTFAAPRGIQTYQTPQGFKDALDAIYHFDPWDPCPLEWTAMRDGDGLKETPEWVHSYFCNPPYSNVHPWLDKAIADKKRGVTAILLLRVDTSTNWMHDRLFPYARPIWVRGRLRFTRPGEEKPKPSPFASVVAAYEPRVSFPVQTVMWQDKAGVWHVGNSEEVLV